jgi:small-conductance mechanosensitive channel
VNVPKSQLSTGIIENLTARTKILYEPDLPLRYDTSREKLMAVLEAIENSLVDNPRVENETIRVRLREFSPNAIIVRIRIFALTRSIDTYLEIVQEVNLDIMQIMDDHEVRFPRARKPCSSRATRTRPTGFSAARRPFPIPSSPRALSGQKVTPCSATQRPWRRREGITKF